MADVYITIPRKTVNEGTYFTATVYYRDVDTEFASASANTRFRVDNLTTGENAQPWTSIGIAVSVNIMIGPNTITGNRKNVLMQITVESDTGETGAANTTLRQNRTTTNYRVINNRAFTD